MDFGMFGGFSGFDFNHDGKISSYERASAIHYLESTGNACSGAVRGNRGYSGYSGTRSNSQKNYGGFHNKDSANGLLKIYGGYYSHLK